MKEIVLNQHEARVLGCLIEKQFTTPDYYPLSLHALNNACNQKSNRDPVMELDEGAVRDALRGLNDLGLAGAVSAADSRVTKYEHRLGEAFNYNRMEYALICVLLLRGPQTPGELRGRSERLFPFESLEQVAYGLQLLMRREPPQVKVLPRQPGTKESRYAHLLCGDVDAAELPSTAPQEESADAPRLARLEEQVAALQTDCAELRQQLAEFRKQFE